MQAKIRLEHKLLAVETEHVVHAMLELMAPAAPGKGPRLPLHLALVVDRSGSMAGPKLQTTRACAAFLARRLQSHDELALVAYDDQVRILAPLGSPTPTLLSAIEAIAPGGQTNLSGGWLLGMDALRRAQGPGARKVLLLTDGLANVGITNVDALVALAAGAREKGIGTTTIGFGDGFNEALLTAMADAGGGNAHYAATPDAAPAIFHAEFEDLVALVAQNVSVEIRPTDQVKLVGVLNDSPAVGVDGGIQVQLGDAHANERRRMVFELHVPEVARLGEAKVADVVVRYVTVGDEIAAHELTLPLVANVVSAEEAARAETDREVQEEVIVLRAARAREEAYRRADQGDFEAARRTLESAAGQLRAMAPGSPQAESLLRQSQQMDEAVPLLTSTGYTAAVKKGLHFQSHRIKRGRPDPSGKGR